MKTTIILLILAIASVFTSCTSQTAAIHQGGTACSSANCSPSRGSQLRGSASIVQNSNWSFSLVDLQVSPSRGYAGYSGGYQQPCSQGYRPQQYRGYQQPCGYQQQGYGYQQPRNGYQQSHNGYQSYYGGASNPIMVNGVAFSDQYPGGVRVAPSR